jgi:hypothetical protein
MSGESASSQRRIEAAERRREALKLRKAGATYDQIADRLGYANKSGAQKAVMAELRALPRDDARDVLALEIERLDSMLLAYWPSVLKGHVRSGEIVIRLMERRSKLLGLDATESIQRDQGVAEAKAMLTGVADGLRELYQAQGLGERHVSEAGE